MHCLHADFIERPTHPDVLFHVFLRVKETFLRFGGGRHGLSDRGLRSGHHSVEESALSFGGQALTGQIYSVFILGPGIPQTEPCPICLGDFGRLDNRVEAMGRR